MSRIVLFGKSKRRTRTTAHIARAFKESGHEVLWLNAAKIRRRRRDSHTYIIGRIERFEPEIVFIYSQDIPLGVLEEIVARGIKTALYYEDWSSEVPSSLVDRGKMVDFFLATNEGMLPQYRQAGIKNPVYFVGACDRRDHRSRHPILPLWKSDIAFIGTARHGESRTRLPQQLSREFNVKVYGKNWQKFGFRPTLKTVTPRSYGLICGGARIVLGADITNAVKGYWSNRLWLTLGCGGFYLAAYVNGMERYFENKKHLVWYHHEEQCVQLARYYINRPEERKRISRQGYELVHKHYTFHHFADRMISLVS